MPFCLALKVLDGKQSKSIQVSKQKSHSLIRVVRLCMIQSITKDMYTNKMTILATANNLESLSNCVGRVMRTVYQIMHPKLS